MDRRTIKADQFQRKCPICRKPYTGSGHNAIPVWPGRCCDKCYKDYVIPMRIALMDKSKDEEMDEENKKT